MPLTRLAAEILARSKQVYMMHGTSSKLLRKILKEGLNPSPKSRVWSDEDDPRESFGGVYLTQKWHNAFTAAHNAMSKFGGNRLYVVVKLAVRHPYVLPDEDIIPWMHLRGVFHADPIHGVDHWYSFFEQLRDDTFPKALDQAAQEVGRWLVKDLLNTWRDVPPESAKRIEERVTGLVQSKKSQDLLRDMVVSAIRYAFATYLQKLSSGSEYEVFKAVTDLQRFFGQDLSELDPSFQDLLPKDLVSFDPEKHKLLQKPVHTVKREWMQKTDSFLKGLRRTLPYVLEFTSIVDSPVAEMRDNVRVIRPITYRGANRIVAIYEEQGRTSDGKAMVFEVHYESDGGARSWFVSRAGHTGYDIKFV